MVHDEHAPAGVADQALGTSEMGGRELAPGDRAGHVARIGAGDERHEAVAYLELGTAEIGADALLATELDAGGLEERREVAALGDDGRTAHAAERGDLLEGDRGADEQQDLCDDGTVHPVREGGVGLVERGEKGGAGRVVRDEPDPGPGDALERGTMLAGVRLDDAEIRARGALGDVEAARKEGGRDMAVMSAQVPQASLLSSAQLDHPALLASIVAGHDLPINGKRAQRLRQFSYLLLNAESGATPRPRGDGAA